MPLWVVVLMAILAILAALDRILIPSVRWALRRRANRAIEELNTKLKLRIQPFKLTKRQVLTDRLVFDPEVLRAAEEYSTRSRRAERSRDGEGAALRPRDRSGVQRLCLFSRRHPDRAGGFPYAVPGADRRPQ